MKFIVAPDSFKESLSATQVARTIEEAIRSVYPSAIIDSIPLADGGEGTVDALVAATEGSIQLAEVTGPLGLPVTAGYGIIDYGDEDTRKQVTAVLEAAAIYGLSMIPLEDRNPYRTTTRGMGEMILKLLDQGIRRFIIGLGGSGTNDGGMGLLAALGIQFYDGHGQLLEGYGQDLLELNRISIEHLDHRLSECDILIASDVQNPLCGMNGAAAVYGPQKGARPEQVEALDKGLDRYSLKLEEQTGLRVKGLAGAGAAGGVGFALLSLGAELASGASIIASVSNLKSRMIGADWVITGEGRSDHQTLNGKLPLYVAWLAKEVGVRTILISGSLGANSDELEKEFTACFSCVPRPMSLIDCLENAKDQLYRTTRNLIRLLS